MNAIDDNKCLFADNKKKPNKYINNIRLLTECVLAILTPWADIDLSVSFSTPMSWQHNKYMCVIKNIVPKRLLLYLSFIRVRCNAIWKLNGFMADAKVKAN